MKKLKLLIFLCLISTIGSLAQNYEFPGTGSNKNLPYGRFNLNWDTSLYIKEVYSSPVDYYKVPYRLLSPPNNNPAEKYPLFIMLHGGGEGMGSQCSATNGNNICPLGWGGRIMIDSSAKYPSFAFFPQTFGGFWGNNDGPDYEFPAKPAEPTRCIIEIIENVLLKNYNIDPDRIYLAGLSAGGRGAWELLERRPDLFAATTPFAGMGNPKLARILVNNPIWNYQGGKDNNPNPFETKRMFDSLVSAGGSPKRSNYHDRDHWAWVDAYQSNSWMNWVFSQSKKNIHILYGKEPIIPAAGSLAIGISYGYKSYQWKLNGVAITGANNYIYNATNSGTYTVSYTRFDGSIGESNPLVIGGDVINLPPVATGQQDIEVLLPSESIVITGTGTDADGTIDSYLWTPLEGPEVTLSGDSTPNLTLVNPNVAVYSFLFSVKDNVGAVATDTVKVTVKGTAEVILDSLQATFDGTPKPAIAKTVPEGLNVTFTYNNDPALPVNAGTYTVIATVNDPNYIGSATGTLNISKAIGTITFNELLHTFDGIAKPATASTVPADLTVNYTYDGISQAPANAGTYAVVANINDPNYFGMAFASLIIKKIPAIITIGEQVTQFDGAAKFATATTTPPGLNVDYTYNDSITLPVNAGIYQVAGVVNDSNYYGSATGSLVIEKAMATVQLIDLNTFFDGSPKPVRAVTVPENLNVVFIYDSVPEAPSQAGTYQVIGTIDDVNYQGSAKDYLIINTITSLQKDHSEKTSIYPNPTSDFITIKTDRISGQKIRITNNIGVTVLNKSLNQIEEKLDVKHLSKGIYTLIIEKGPSQELFKFSVY